MCIYVDDDMRTHLASGERRARKPHQCQECKRTIDPGETYRYWTVIDQEYGTGPETEKMCAHCYNTIDLGASFTGCPRAWYWDQVHDLKDYEGGSFVADILREHTLTTSQARAMIRCVRGRRRQWRDADGNLLPLVTERRDNDQAVAP
jgi:hypothetical protein